MSEFLALLSLPPIFRGFIGMILSGVCFPLCGLMVIRLKLIPLRYMLMHGVMLGGAIALAMKLPLVPVIILVNIFLIFFMLFISKNQGFGFNGASATVMVITMALASFISHIKDVPSKDSLNLLWGSPFALTNNDIIILGIVLIFTLVFIVINFNKILAFFYSDDIAVAMGFKKGLYYDIIILLIAFIVALGMKLLGAFLVDSLLLLPVLCASSILKLFKKGNGIKNLFIASGVLGFVFSFTGYIISVIKDYPPSSVIALIAGASFVISSIFSKLIKVVRYEK